MSHEKKWMQSHAGGDSLHTELLTNVPIIEVCDRQRVLIENHQGVTQYGRETICIKVKFGQICIAGCDLELARMTKEQLVITGQIDGVSLYRGCT
ncbi:MAG: YabP/YqfC family sporulation protein [Oscillospiraceae bacterium]|nr:YabP/YqfC family sporulation protein [Oscillospiraceae bacterium]